MFDLTGKTRARHRRDRRHRRRDRPGAARAGRDGRAVAARAVEALEALAAELGERAIVVAGQSLRPRRGRGAGAGGRGGAGRARHPRQQCRHHPRQSLHAHEGRGVGRGASRVNLDRRLPPVARRAARHDEARFGRIIGITSVVGVDRQSRAGQLRRLQGRPDRHVQGAGRTRSPAATSPSTASRRASSRRP